MKNLLYLFLVISLLSCNSKQAENKNALNREIETEKASDLKETELILGERIDGPANVRSKPNGEVIFELFDNALVEVSTKPENDWYEVLIYTEISPDEYDLDSINKDRPIIMNTDTVGRIIKTHSVSSGQNRDFTYAILNGFTHKDNIKPETIVESVFEKHLAENGRNLSAWRGFIKSFKLDTEAIGYAPYQTFYNYETAVGDPSPGFRIVLLFEKEQLVGLIHARALKIAQTKTHKLARSYHVTFFEAYPEKEQIKFVDYMNEWIQGVD